MFRRQILVSRRDRRCSMLHLKTHSVAVHSVQWRLRAAPLSFEAATWTIREPSGRNRYADKSAQVTSDTFTSH